MNDLTFITQFPPRHWDRFPPVVDAIRQAQPSVKRVGAIGFCWGATACLYLSSSKAGKSQVDAVAFAHPSVIEPSDFEMLEKPGLFMTCQTDAQFPKEKQEASKLVCEKQAEQHGVFSRYVGSSAFTWFLIRSCPIQLQLLSKCVPWM